MGTCISISDRDISIREMEIDDKLLDVNSEAFVKKENHTKKKKTKIEKEIDDLLL